MLSLLERGVQRGRLARAGRAGDQQDAVRLLEHVRGTAAGIRR